MLEFRSLFRLLSACLGVAGLFYLLLGADRLRAGERDQAWALLAIGALAVGLGAGLWAWLARSRSP
jgi:uncharacterized membrane protein YedE/YeeE